MNINNFSQKRNKSGYRAQAMVGFAIALPILLVLLFGILCVLDPRPKALRSLAQSINQFNKE